MKLITIFINIIYDVLNGGYKVQPIPLPYSLIIDMINIIYFVFIVHFIFLYALQKNNRYLIDTMHIIFVIYIYVLSFFA